MGCMLNVKLRNNDLREIADGLYQVNPNRSPRSRKQVACSKAKAKANCTRMVSSRQLSK